MISYARKNQRQRSLLIFALLCFGLATGLLLILFSGGLVNILHREHSFGHTFDFSAAGLGVWLGLMITWWSLQRGKFDLFELPVWFSINTYGQVVVTAWLFRRDMYVPIPWLQNNPGPYMVSAVWVIGFSLTFLWIGYMVMFRWLEKCPRLTRPVAGPIRFKAVFAIWFILWLISIQNTIAGYSSYLGTGVGTVWSNYLHFLDLVRWAAWSALVLHYFRQPTRFGWSWIILTLSTDVLLGLIVGTKSSVLIFIWLCLLAYYATGKLRGGWAVAGVLGVIVIVPAVNTIRDNLHEVNIGSGVQFENRLGVVSKSVQQILEEPLGDLSAEATDTFAARQSGLLQITASVMFLHPDIMPFIGVDILWQFLQGIVPRIVWPGKPAGLPLLYDISGVYYGIQSSRSAIGQFADSYRVGGWSFVAIWFVLLGILSAWLYQQGPKAADNTGIVFYFILLGHVITFNTNITALLLTLVQMGPLLWILIMHIMYDSSTTMRTNSICSR